jgi:hypothetical protein
MERRLRGAFWKVRRLKEVILNNWKVRKLRGSFYKETGGGGSLGW